MTRARLGLAVLGLSLVAAPAMAGDAQETFRNLLKQGYEIKSTELIPKETALEYSKEDNGSQFFVTLQKADSVAVCWFAWSNWGALNKESLENPARCEVVK